jgi:hypothetical protein
MKTGFLARSQGLMIGGERESALPPVLFLHEAEHPLWSLQMIGGEPDG